MVKEPIIRYTPIRYRRQMKNKCVANAVAALWEKLFELQGKEVRLDENDLDGYLRGVLNDFKCGIKTFKALNHLKDVGYKGMKIKDCFSLVPTPENAYELLKTSPLILSIWRYSDYPKGKIVKGYYNIGENVEKSHVICVFGYDNGFLCLDSSRDIHTLSRIRFEDFREISRRMYLIKI